MPTDTIKGQEYGIFYKAPSQPWRSGILEGNVTFMSGAASEYIGIALRGTWLHRDTVWQLEARFDLQP